jgi:hypothetical protein
MISGKGRIGICFMLVVIPLGIFDVWCEVNRPDLLLDPMIMRYIWVASAAFLAGIMLATKKFTKGGVGGSLLVMLLGPIAVLTTLLYVIWHKISPIKEE